MTLNFTDCIDVTNDETLEQKMAHILGNGEILSFMEEYEYKKAYRHFCYFRYTNISFEKIEELVKNREINVFDRREQKSVDEFDKPTIYIAGEEIYFKFSIKLTNDVGGNIKYVFLAVIDKEHNIIEFRFDKIGIEYKNSYNFYKDMVMNTLEYFNSKIDLVVENIDFKALVDFIKDKEDVTIYAQRMMRNGTTAYLEAFEDEESVIPILGELTGFVSTNDELFEENEATKKIKQLLVDFIKDIEIKSDMPMVKIRLDESKVKFGITHNYKDTDFSMFMMYGELVGEKEMMSNVKGYLMQCCREFNNAISVDTLPTEEM